MYQRIEKNRELPRTHAQFSCYNRLQGTFVIMNELILVQYY